MKKILWVVVLAVLLSGCSWIDPERGQPETIPVEVEYGEPTRPLQYQDVELTMQSIWKRENPQARILTEAAALFEAQTGAQVRIFWPDAQFAGNVDILQLPAADLDAVSGDVLLDLTQMAGAAGYEKKSHEVLRRQVTEQFGFLAAIPQVPYLGGIYYNVEVFQQCGIERTPRNWEEFLALCQTLRENGWQPLTMDKPDALIAAELHLRRAIGTAEVARLMSADGHWQSDKPAIAALEQVMEFVKESNMAFLTPAEHPAGQNKMALSNSAMMVGTNADCAEVERATLTDLQWGMFAYPGKNSSGTWMTADVLAIPADCENPQAAFDFLMLLTTGEFDQLRADISGGIPADPSNASPVAGAMEALEGVQPEPLGLLTQKQLETAVRLWSGWYADVSGYTAALERSK